MKAEQQSICPPYAQKIKSNYEHEPCEGKNVNKRKKNETILAVARLLIKDPLLKRSEMADICGISQQEISAALKKIQGTIGEGHTIIGLNIMELEMLKTNIDKRKSEEESTTIKIANLLIQDFIVNRSKIADICGITPQKVSSNLKKIQQIIKEGGSITGLNKMEIEILKSNIELREVYLKSQQDELLRDVARVILRNYRISGKDIAQELHIKEPNVSCAIKTIKTRIGYQGPGAEETSSETSKKQPLGIMGLSPEENARLLQLITNREKEVIREKELRQQERALEKANRESMREIVRQAKRKTSKKPATISATGLAEWNVMSYDASTGRIDYDYIFKGYKKPKDNPKEVEPGLPRDLPRRLPKRQMVMQTNTPDSSYIIPEKASGTAAGRRRKGIMQLS